MTDAAVAVTEQVAIGDVTLSVRGESQDAAWYRQRGCFEERASILYKLLRREAFTAIVDVGANYGFISIIARKENPDIEIFAFEADPRLEDLIRANFEQNGISDFKLRNVVVSAVDQPEATFSLNPRSTLDNRVEIAAWKKVAVPAASLSTLLRGRLEHHSGIFFKIDTQGFEQNVLKGAESLLSTLPRWLIKMEFAPNWLRSQGSDPLELLGYLVDRYDVSEFPARIPFGTTSLAELRRTAVNRADIAEFLAHIESLNVNRLGWVDLLVTPRDLLHG